MIRSFFASTFILLVFSIFESAILSNIAFLPSIPDLTLLCVLYFSIQNGKLLGETTGFVSGLFLDVLSACPFGLNCLIRSVTGYAGGIFKKTLNLDGFFVLMFMGFAATILKVILTFVVSILFPFALIATYRIFSIEFAFELALNSILTPFVFKFLSLFKNSVIVKMESSY